MTIANPIAAVVDNVVAADLPADGAAVVVALQPDVPRKLQIDIVDADASITEGTITIIGTDQNGAAVTEVFTLTGGTDNKVSTKAFASVTSAEFSDVHGAGPGDTVSVGVTDALGLVGCQVPAASGYNVYIASVGDAAAKGLEFAREAVGVVDATAGTIIPTTAPNGTRDYQFIYTYAVTEVQASHVHVHSHTHAIHKHTIS
jgi:hypothetical protein